MNDAQEQLGQVIDRLDAIGHALQIPMPAQMHVQSLKAVIPELVSEAKAAFVRATGENPWAC